MARAKSGRVCCVPACTRRAVSGSGGRCSKHRGRRRCQEPNCTKRAKGATKRCVAHGGGKRCRETGCINAARDGSNHCKRHGGGTRCQTPGCTTAAVESTNHCKNHGGGWRCQTSGCTKSARNANGHCTRHGGGSRCQEPGCTKSAQGATDRCVIHGGGTRCQIAGCTNLARDASKRCYEHGGGRRCEEAGCARPAAGATDYCTSHGGGRRCQETDCTKLAISPTDRCVKHGTARRCQEPGCSKIARTDGTRRCVMHGGGYRCAGCKLFCVQSKLGLCSYCDTNRPRQTKEQRVVDFLGRNIAQPISSHDKQIGGNLCLRERPDILYLRPDFALVVEVDENQHEQYDAMCEETRMHNLVSTLAMPTIFVRYNPDAFHLNGTVQRVNEADRLELLRKRVSAALSSPRPEVPLTAEYLFYDEPRVRPILDHGHRTVTFVTSQLLPQQPQITSFVQQRSRDAANTPGAECLSAIKSTIGPLPIASCKVIMPPTTGPPLDLRPLSSSQPSSITSPAPTPPAPNPLTCRPTVCAPCPPTNSPITSPLPMPQPAS
jgi:hypothetical protein